MKKLLIQLTFLALSLAVFAQSAEYKALLKKAKNYEAKKQYASALGTYWDAAAAEKSDQAAEAVESYLKLETIIEDGKPGYGEFDEFTIYDNWVLLLKDFERYQTENPSLVNNLLKGLNERIDFKPKVIKLFPDGGYFIGNADISRWTAWF